MKFHAKVRRTSRSGDEDGGRSEDDLLYSTSSVISSHQHRENLHSHMIQVESGDFSFPFFDSGLP
jgi:hypothetical protein